MSRRQLGGGAIRSAIATTVLSGVLAACSVAADDAPRDIEPSKADVVTAAQGANVRSSGSERIFLVVDLPGLPTRIEPVQRTVGSGAAVDLAATLLAGPTSQEFIDQYRSALPTDLIINAVRKSGPRISIDVSADLQLLSADTLVLALAQIVYTMSDLPDVDSVDITVDGENARWPTSSGELTQQPLTVFDYPNLEVTRQPAYPSTPSD